MRPIGGRRPIEINPKADESLNADVVFQQENVIVEVKTLMADPSERDEYIEKTSAIYNRWVGRPGVPLVYGRNRISSNDLPSEMGFELVQTLAGPIRTAVKKANGQIREVKSSLNMPDAHGVLLLCNSGAVTLTPHIVLHAVHHALGNRHRSVNSGIYVTHGVPAEVAGVPEPVEIFGFFNRSDHQRLPEAFAHKIQHAWMSYQSRNNRLIKLYSGADPSILINATNATRRRP